MLPASFRKCQRLSACAVLAWSCCSICFW